MHDLHSLFRCEGHETEMDPGKDLFALLFMSFFLITVLMLFAVGRVNEQVPVNASSSPSSSALVLGEELLAKIEVVDGKVEVCQGDKCWVLPDAAALLSSEAGLLERAGGEKVLVIEDPGNSVGAGTMLVAVKSLNDQGIGVEFRTRLK